MRIIIAFIALIIYLPARSQNLISNGDFEQCDTSSLAGVSGCSGLPDGNLSELGYVVGWQDVKLPPANVRGTVDWWKNGSICQYWQDAFTKSCATVYAQSGNKFIGMYDGEGAQFDFGSDLPLGVYKVTFWARGNVYNTDSSAVGPNGTWGVSLTVKDDKMALLDQCNLSSGLTIFEQSFDASDYQDWHKIECFFDTRTQAVSHILLGGLWGRDCLNHHSYIYIDNMSVEKTCCARIMRYQNTSLDTTKSFLPRLTQRADSIIAGDSVSIYPIAHGPVVVEKDSSVRFESANNVLILPGFEVKPGGVFSASIEDCGRADSTSEDYSIELLGYSGNRMGYLCQLDCDPNPDSIGKHSLTFTSKGASHYHVRIFNQDSGEKFFDSEGEINEPVTSFFDGSNASGQAPLSDVVLVDLILFNCANTMEVSWRVPIEFHVSAGCSPGKTNTPYNENNFNKQNLSLDGLNVYPIPTNSVIHIKRSIKKIKDVEILNSIAQVVANNFQEKSDGLIDIDLSGLPEGVYLCKVHYSDDSLALRKITISY